ncbi:MAG: alpha/beta fold hydrolase [Bacteroidota bacterium]
MANQIHQWQQGGRFFKVGDHRAFLREEGPGEAVVCVHGVPSSSYLYRKMIPLLARQGYRGLSFDLIGMGLSDKPGDFDYSWTGLGKWSAQAIEALEIEKYHLIIHDIGGPVGVEMLGHHPEKILSVTILNTLLVNLGSFSKPFPMYFFEKKGIGEAFLATTLPLFFQKLMHWRGIHQNKSFTRDDARTYVQLLNHGDKGKAFLQIMRSFEARAAKEKQYLDTLRGLQVPIQIIWGVNDPGLTTSQYGYPLQKALGLDQITELPGSHFLQEDYAEEIVGQVLGMIRG